MKLKVLMSGDYSIDSNKRAGGGYSLIVEMLRFMENIKDIDFHFLTLEKNFEKYKSEKLNGITYHFIPKSRLPTTLASITIDRINIKKYINRINPDIIHTHSVSYPSSIVGITIKKSHILTIHGIVQKEKKSWKGFDGKIKGAIKSYYERKIMKRIEHIIAISEYVKDELQRLYPKSNANYYVFNAGVSNEWLDNLGSVEDGKHLLFVGGIEKRKGLIHLLKAFKIIHKNNPNIILDIVGRVREKNTYRELVNFINNNNLSKAIHFHLNVSNDLLKSYYKNCTIFVLPSQEESLGIVTLEAMSYGKPVVVSNISANPTIVTHMKNGLLATYGDPDDFREKIELFLNSKKLRKRIGKEAKKRVQDYTMDQHCENVYQLYKKLGKRIQKED